MSRTQKKTMSRSKIKVVLVLFLVGKALSIINLYPDGKQLCQEVLARVKDAVRKKRPELWENPAWIRCAPSSLFSGLSPSRLFSCFPNLKLL
jgi:hypothetical protein